MKRNHLNEFYRLEMEVMAALQLTLIKISSRTKQIQESRQSQVGENYCGGNEATQHENYSASRWNESGENASACDDTNLNNTFTRIKQKQLASEGCNMEKENPAECLLNTDSELNGDDSYGEAALGCSWDMAGDNLLAGDPLGEDVLVSPHPPQNNLQVTRLYSSQPELKTRHSSDSSLAGRSSGSPFSSTPISPYTPSPSTSTTSPFPTGMGSRSHSVSFLLKENESYQIHRPAKTISAENLLGDVRFLKSFTAKMTGGEKVEKEKEVEEKVKEEGGGRYSLLDQNMEPVDRNDHVITNLWKLSEEKVQLAMVGHMDSCQEEETEIDCSQFGRSSTETAIRADSSASDYRNHLVPIESRPCSGDNTDSGDDTDDLIEDARNFVQIAQRKLVTLDDWERIDFQRTERRKRRRETATRSRRRRMRMGSQGEAGEEEEEELGDAGSAQHDEDDSDSQADVNREEELFLPRKISELKIGTVVKVLPIIGTGMLPGIVRYVGPVEGRGESAGVELRERKGNSDGTCGSVRYFSCKPGYAVFLPVSRVIVAWRNMRK